MRLLVLSLLRAGKIEATSKGQTVDTVTTVEARETFSNNNLFRQASFRPKKGVEFEELIKASEAFRETFGSDVRELNAGAIATELRKEVARHEDEIAGALHTLTVNRLPGAAVLETALGQMKAVLRDSEDNAISMFNASHRSVKAAIKRAAEVEQTVTDTRVRDLERARRAVQALWPFLQSEGGMSTWSCTNKRACSRISSPRGRPTRSSPRLNRPHARSRPSTAGVTRRRSPPV